MDLRERARRRLQRDQPRKGHFLHVVRTNRDLRRPDDGNGRRIQRDGWSKRRLIRRGRRHGRSGELGSARCGLGGSSRMRCGSLRALRTRSASEVERRGRRRRRCAELGELFQVLARVLASGLVTARDRSLGRSGRCHRGRRGFRLEPGRSGQADHRRLTRAYVRGRHRADARRGVECAPAVAGLGFDADPTTGHYRLGLLARRRGHRRGPGLDAGPRDDTGLRFD